MTPLYELKPETPPEMLPKDGVKNLLKQLAGGWEVDDNSRLFKRFKFKDYTQTMAFVNNVAGLAQNMNHHPDILVSFKHVEISLTTHDVKGLSIFDFILAAKIDRI
jgi:4a-hydroxytetrahydrobiopterin dehydratase